MQIHEQKLKEQEELIKLLLAQLSPQQQQPKNSAKEAAKAQHQVLKQLASLKMVRVHALTVDTCMMFIIFPAGNFAIQSLNLKMNSLIIVNQLS